MLYVFFGSDTSGVRMQAHEFVAEKGKVTEGLLTQNISSENFEAGILESATEATSLFSDPQLTIIDTPSSSSEMDGVVMGMVDVLADSEHTFVIIENALLAPKKKKYAKCATDMVEVSAGKVERFNVFGMADALARKDKKTLWILLQNARQAGLSEEEIIGTLWWQLKALRLAGRNASADEAGLKPFVYQKTKRALSSFRAGELEDISERLLRVYHDGHAGKVDIEIALERWVLTL